MGHVPIELDVHVAEEVLRSLEAGQHLVQVDDEPLDITLVAAVVVVGIGVVDRPQQVHVEAVDGARVAGQHVPDGALVGGLPNRLVHAVLVRSHRSLPWGGDSRACHRAPQPRPLRRA